tara:strand:- start:983 stop:1216 length:234 start_codon:yes stop_codon:yes gene_type:complete
MELLKMKIEQKYTQTQKLTNSQIIEAVRVHEAECAIRTERINEKFVAIDKSMSSIESKIWIIAALIVGTAITNIAMS